jgi:hypothetical protein
MPSDRLGAECNSSSGDQFRRDRSSSCAGEWSHRDMGCCCRICLLALSIGKNCGVLISVFLLHEEWGLCSIIRISLICS